MALATGLARIFAYLQNFCVAWQNCGWFSAVRLFVYGRRTVGSDGVSINVKKIGRRIAFRGKTDKGVLSHFYKPGYRIRDTPSSRVRSIVDVGANIGDETLRFRHFHPDATIVAIEPDSANFAFLTRNAGPDAKIHPLKKGLWSRERRLRVVPGETAEAFSVEEAADDSAADVEAVSVSSLMRSFSLDEIDILKMDIEGAEYEVFAAPDIDSWISRVKVLIVECPDSDRPGATQKLFEAISGLNFNCYISGENLVLIRRDTGWKLESNAYL